MNRSRHPLAVFLSSLSCALALAAQGMELFVPDVFYARVPDRAAKEDLVSISIEGKAAEGAPGACVFSVRSDEDDALVVVEYTVAVSSGDAPCSVRLSCTVEPKAFAAVAPGLTDQTGRPAPDAAARLRPLLEVAEPRLGEKLLLLERTKALFLATLEVPPRHALRNGDIVPLSTPAMDETERPGPVLFSDDFDSPALFAERWTARGRPMPDGRKLRLAGDVLAMRRETPADFIAEMKVALLPDWASSREPLGKFAGFRLGSLYFCIRTDGMTFVKRPQDGAEYLRVPVEGYAHGKPQTLRVARKISGSSAIYAFWVNGVEITRFRAAAQLDKPLEILAEHRHVQSLEAEIDDFALHALERGAEGRVGRGEP